MEREYDSDYIKMVVGWLEECEQKRKQDFGKCVKITKEKFVKISSREFLFNDRIKKLWL